MKKMLLVGGSIIVVVLLVVCSLTNVVGYQSVQVSNQKIVNEEINQKELLFQTIVDIANNKEIQKIALNSEMTGKGLFRPGVRFSRFNNPVLTRSNLKRMYFVGVMLSKSISKSRMHSLVEQYQMNHQGMQKEIAAVIKKNATLNGEIMQLLTFKCNCGNENTTRWSFPVLCFLMWPLVILAIFLFYKNIGDLIVSIVLSIGYILNCTWF